MRTWVLACAACVGACVGEGPPAVVEGDGGRWELRAPLPGGPRQETAVVALGGEVYVIGGFNGVGAVVPLVEVYDPARDSWRRVADVPVPLHHGNAVAVPERDEIVVAGFLQGVDFAPIADVLAYRRADDAWEFRAPMPGAEARGASGTALLDGELLSFGGLQQGSSALVSAYDVDGDSWRALADLDTPLDHLAAALVGTTVVIVGGRTDGIANHTSAVGAFDGEGVAPRSPMPTARGGFAAAAVDGRLVIAGGEGAPAPGGVFDDVEVYDAAADAWRTVLPMRTPRHGMGAASVDGVVIVPGGADVQGFGAVDVVEALVLD